MTRLEAIRAKVNAGKHFDDDAKHLLALVDDLAEALGEISVHEGDPRLEAEQMRSAARAALARTEE